MVCQWFRGQHRRDLRGAAEHVENHLALHPYRHRHQRDGLYGSFAILYPPAAEGDSHSQGDGLDIGRGAAADAPHVLDPYADFVCHSCAYLVVHHDRLAQQLQLSHLAQPLDIRCRWVYLLHHFPAHRHHPELARCF